MWTDAAVWHGRCGGSGGTPEVGCGAGRAPLTLAGMTDRPPAPTSSRAAGTADHWPLRGLRVRTPRLELRYPSPQELDALADLAADGIHAPDFMPFSVPWTDVEPAERARAVLQWAWRQAGAFTAEGWNLGLVTVVDGAVVGTQGIEAGRFPVLREVETGSWLGLGYHGRGIGTEMRHAIVHLAFAGLGAEYVTSSAFEDNLPSLGVSRKVGYEPDGIMRQVRRDKPGTLIRLRLARADWERRRRDDIEVVGLAPCLPLFGLAGAG
jgi:RimJ/RimL family protein N-acetyltransferase